MASVTAEWSSYVSGAKGVNTVQFYSKEQALVLGHQEQRLRIPSGVFGQNYQWRFWGQYRLSGDHKAEHQLPYLTSKTAFSHINYF